MWLYSIRFEKMEESGLPPGVDISGSFFGACISRAFFFFASVFFLPLPTMLRPLQLIKQPELGRVFDEIGALGKIGDQARVLDDRDSLSPPPQGIVGRSFRAPSWPLRASPPTSGVA